MKTKVLTGIAAAMIAASIPAGKVITAFAQDQTVTEEITEKENSAGAKKQLPAEFNREKTGFSSERPEFNGELPPEFSGEMPEFNGERPESDGEMPPEFDGEMPEIDRELPFGRMHRGGMRGRMHPGRKSDEEALAEGNPAPELPEDLTEE